MDSPYLAGLKARVDGAQTSTEAAVAQAEIAIYYARVGDFAEADSMVRLVRSTLGERQSGRVTVLLMCAEALLSYYRDIDSAARQRLMSAHVLCSAGRDPRLIALTAAWLAHLDFNVHRHADLARSVATCIAAIDVRDLDTLCRLGLTVGDALCVCGLDVESRAWYAKARAAAQQLGDHATIAAMTGNHAALRVFGARLAALRKGVDLAEAKLIAGEVRTARSYQALAQLRSFDDLLMNAEISALILQSRYSEAVIALESLDSIDVRTSPVSAPVNLACDLMLSYALSGQAESAGALLAQFDAQRLSAATDDDQALAYHALSQITRVLGDEPLAAEYEEKAHAALARHLSEIEKLNSLMAPFRSTAVLEPGRLS